MLWHLQEEQEAVRGVVVVVVVFEGAWEGKLGIVDTQKNKW